MKKIKIIYFFLSVISGVLLAFSFQKINAFYLAWFALIPLMFCIKKNKIGESVVYGFIAGFSFYMISLFWMIPFLQFNLHSWLQTIFVSSVLWLYLTLFFVLWVLSVCGIKRYYSNTIVISVGSALSWAVIEYIRTYLFTGFGWNLLGYSQVSFLPVIQIADVTGVYGVSALVVLVNMSLFMFIKNRDKKRLILCLAVFVIALLYGIFKLNSFDVKQGIPLKVGIVQPSVDQYRKWNRAYFYESIEKIERTAEKIKDQNVDITIYPETVLPGYIEDDVFVQSVAEKLSNYSRLTLITSPGLDAYGNVYNSVFALDSDCKIIGRHDKNHLMLFGEYIPMRRFFARYFKNLNAFGEDFARGKFMMAFKYKDINVGSTICSENFYPDLARETVNNGAGFIVNHTNDAWFFDLATPYQHFVMNILRAVENRKYVAISANTGISAIIEPTGRIVAKTQMNAEDVIIGIVYQNDIKTLYDKVGDSFIYLSVMFLILIFVIIFIK